jgi:hypothetical protein
MGVKKFREGFIPGLNEPAIPEYAGSIANIAAAKTRILKGSQLNITGLSKGKHLFECSIHPWMRVAVLPQIVLLNRSTLAVLADHRVGSSGKGLPS